MLSVRYLVLIFSVILLVLIFLSSQHRSVYSQQRSPDGRYNAQVSYNTYLSFLPVMPGQSSDKAGFVEIFDNTGRSMGRMPLAMLQMADIRWLTNGAEIKLVGHWDFVKGSCQYLDQQDRYQPCL